MMRMFCMIIVAALLVPGCSEKGTQTARKPESKGVKAQDVVQRMTKNKAVETRTRDSAETNQVDPAFDDYIYPGSKLDGQFSMGNTESLQYMSQDDFINVVDYYKQKFPDTHVGSGTSVYFGTQHPDGSDLTVTLTKLDNGTQVILKLDKKI